MAVDKEVGSLPELPCADANALAMQASPNGNNNPYYTPTIMAAFRAYKEAQYGGRLADEAFRLGKGKYEDEPHYTQMAIEFRLFKAGAEWVEAFREADGAIDPFLDGRVRDLAQALKVIGDASERAETMFGGSLSDVTRVFKNITRVARLHLSPLEASVSVALKEEHHG